MDTPRPTKHSAAAEAADNKKAAAANDNTTHPPRTPLLDKGFPPNMAAISKDDRRKMLHALVGEGHRYQSHHFGANTNQSAAADGGVSKQTTKSVPRGVTRITDRRTRWMLHQDIKHLMAQPRDLYEHTLQQLAMLQMFHPPSK